MAEPAQLWGQWGLLLTGGKTPSPHVNVHNAALIVENDPAYKGSVYYDEFLQRIMRRNSPAREWRDSDDLELLRHVQNVIAIPRMGRDSVSQAIISVAHKDRRNCVKEWMESLTWDQTPRIESFFSDYFGAPQDSYTGSAGRNFWISMIARVFEPGCKVDNMIVLEGGQGVGKSTSMHIIGGDWFTEQHESATNPKAFAEILQGKLLVEISEMDSFTRAEVSRVKQAISCRSDRFRASYGRHAADHPRTCVFVGTTNRDDWNRDDTGARRFWPIRCVGEINLKGIEETRLQCFAEAVTRYKLKEQHWVMPAEETKAQQDARYQADVWMSQIAEIIKGETSVTTSHVASKLNIPTERQDRNVEMRIGACLRFMRWERKRRRIGGVPAWVYLPEGRNDENGENTQLFEDK